MKNRIQLRLRVIPARLIVDQDVKKSTRKPLLDVLREWLGLVTAGAGIFAVLLYLAGRSYAGGYFSAMNIPTYQVSFTLWEYGEAGWTPLLLYPVGMVFIVSFINWIFSVLSDWITPILTAWLNRKTKHLFPKIQAPTKSEDTQMWFSVAARTFYFLMLIVVLFLTLQVAKRYGEVSGKLAVVQNAPQVELVTKKLIPLDDSKTIEPLLDDKGIYIYRDFHLLTYNNGKYYLFKDLDWATCKPAKVYVVTEKEDVYINLLPPTSLSSQCQTKTTPVVTAIPSPIPTP